MVCNCVTLYAAPPTYNDASGLALSAFMRASSRLLPNKAVIASRHLCHHQAVLRLSSTTQLSSR